MLRLQDRELAIRNDDGSKLTMRVGRNPKTGRQTMMVSIITSTNRISVISVDLNQLLTGMISLTKNTLTGAYKHARKD